MPISRQPRKWRETFTTRINSTRSLPDQNKGERHARMLLPFFAVCLCIRLLLLRRSALHLPSVMALYAPDSLLQTIRTTVLVIWMRRLMLVKYDACPRCRILGIMNEPIMAGVPAHHSHIKGICEDDGEVIRIQCRKIFRIKHRCSPSPDPSHILPAALPQTAHEAPSSPSRNVHAVFLSPSP